MHEINFIEYLSFVDIMHIEIESSKTDQMARKDKTNVSSDMILWNLGGQISEKTWVVFCTYQD